jgi:hypothetical protein
MMLIALAGPFAQRRFAPKSDWIAASDFNSVLKTIFDKGSKGSPEKSKSFWNILWTMPNRPSLSFGMTSRSRRGRCSHTRR